MFWTKLSSLAVLAALTIISQSATAQQMGREGYNFPARAPSMAAQFDFQGRMDSNSAASAGGMGALNQYVTQYSSSSTSIANMNQVNQTVTGGSTASVGQTADQTSAGNQDSVADTKTKIDNSITALQKNSNNQP